MKTNLIFWKFSCATKSHGGVKISSASKSPPGLDIPRTLVTAKAISTNVVTDRCGALWKIELLVSQPMDFVDFSSKGRPGLDQCRRGVDTFIDVRLPRWRFRFRFVIGHHQRDNCLGDDIRSDVCSSVQKRSSNHRQSLRKYSNDLTSLTVM